MFGTSHAGMEKFRRQRAEGFRCCRRVALHGRQYLGPEAPKRRSVPRRLEGHVPCQDVAFDGSKSLEERGLIPKAVGEPLRAKHMCDGKSNEIGFKFYDLTATVTKEGGTPHTINLCPKCYDCRRKEQGEEMVNNRVWREMRRQKPSVGRLGRLR